MYVAGDDVILYPVMALPFVTVGAVQLTVTYFVFASTEAVPIVGVPGTPVGVMEFDELE